MLTASLTTMNNDYFQTIFNKYTLDCKIIGVGTGKTMEQFSTILPSNFDYVASSNQTLMFLKDKTVIDIQTVNNVDIYFDSADYVDRRGNLIKGGGGALFKEKLLSRMAKKTVIIITENKIVDSLEELYVPTEILKSAMQYVSSILDEKKIKYKPRLVKDVTPFITDNGNFILDIQYNREFLKNCKSITGVVEHGYFENDNYFIEKVTL